MSQHLTRGLMLLQQERYDLAKDELQQAVMADPNSGRAHSTLAVCLVEMNEFHQAKEECLRGIQLAPDSAYSFYCASAVLFELNDFEKAEEYIDSAIEIDSTDPDFFAQLAAIKVSQKEWDEALWAAEEGLSFDPESVSCTNLRAIALTKLNRREEAFQSIDSNLRNSPLDSVSHANMGWNLVESGKMTEAMEHFREALRLDPESEWARMGIIEAMKGQYFIYRIVLSWFLWVGKLQGKAQAAIVFGGWIGYQVALRLMSAFPVAKWLLMPLVIAYVGFVIMTWTSVPLFNLLLRTNKFGRLVLSKEEKRSSAWVALSLLTAVAGVIFYFISNDAAGLAIAGCGGFMIPVLGTYYNSDQGWPRAAHGLLALFLLFFAFLTIGCILARPFIDQSSLVGPEIYKFLNGLSLLSFMVFLVAALIAQFLVQYFIAAVPRKGSDLGRNLWVFGLMALAAMALMVGSLITFVIVTTHFQPFLPPADGM